MNYRAAAADFILHGMCEKQQALFAEHVSY